jgi:hypothetical protein
MMAACSSANQPKQSATQPAASPSATVSSKQFSIGSLLSTFPSAVPTIGGGNDSVCSELFGSSADVSTEFSSLDLGAASIDGGQQGAQDISCDYTNTATDPVHRLEISAFVAAGVDDENTDPFYVVHNGSVYLTLDEENGTAPLTNANKMWAQNLVARITP